MTPPFLDSHQLATDQLKCVEMHSRQCTFIVRQRCRKLKNVKHVLQGNAHAKYRA